MADEQKDALKDAQRVAEDTPQVGAQATEQEPGQDPDEARGEGTTPRDDDGNFSAKGKPAKGVQPVEDDDIPDAGR